jgi:hypothetical protein
MAKERSDTHDEELVEAATLRAALMSWLETNPGMHAVSEIAEGTVTDRGRTSHMLKRMAVDGLIRQTGGGERGSKMTFGLEPGPTSAAVKKSSGKVAKPKVTKVKDIELVVSGVEIVIGRNPLTGRLRITLEG